MNSTTITLTSYLANVQTQIIRSMLTTTLIIGNLGSLANILVFSHSSLRSHICSWYFIGTSMGHLLYINMGCSTRVIWAWTQFDLTSISLEFCKARIYFVLNGLTISRYLLCLISIDRWMITSRNVRIRQKSSPKIARWLIIGGILFMIIINVFVSVGYVIDTTQGCGPSNDSLYSWFYTIYNTTLSLAPMLTLIIFSSLIFFNIRQVGHHQGSPMAQATSNHGIPRRRRRYRKKDIQFIKLALIQVAGYILFNTLHGYNTLYGVTTRYKVKSAEQRVIEDFLNGMGLNLHYMYTGITFFLYTLASVTFRKACIVFCIRWFERVSHLAFPRPTRPVAVRHT